MKKIYILCLLALLSTRIQAQDLTQTVRGKITDEAINTPLIGATIVIPGSNPFKGAAVDMDGNFKITEVPVGRHTFKITYIGYKEKVMSNVEVTSGKELVLNIQMEESAVMAKEVTISGKVEKGQALNEMSTVSSRSFSVEETQRYAAALNDPARMATVFASVGSTSDGDNNIVIRGNAPNTVLWRMEGIEIPNPNHFSVAGSSGGGISILSAQLLTNSDFLTSAFPAEYGNALAGVFDLKLRKGNNEKREYTFQTGLLGFEGGVEGPLSSGNSGSYLVNYRYSTLGLLSNLGVNIGDGKSTFQDLSFNLSMPTKRAGNFTVFGFGGLSSYIMNAKADSSKWEYEEQRYDEDFHANTGVAGVTHSKIIGERTYIKTAVATSIIENKIDEKKLDNNYNKHQVAESDQSKNKTTISTTLNHKINAKHLLRTGVIGEHTGYNMTQSIENDTTNIYEQQLNEKSHTFLVQAFLQWQYRFAEDWTLNSGVHYQQLALNNSYAIEPRVGLKWQATSKDIFTAGYGLHSQVHPTSIYFTEMRDANNKVYHPNKNLEMSKAHHFVAGYDRTFSSSIHLKTEIYYQHLFDIPVDATEENSFSMVNEQSGLVYQDLCNNGTATNYGAEITIEKFLTNGYYGMLSTSLYNSRYKGSDEIERNTLYNGNAKVTLTTGKEIQLSESWKSRVLGLNLKLIYAGGTWDTPIDVEKSKKYETTYYINEKANTIQNPDYMRADVRVSLKRNRSRVTTTWALDIQNATNHENLLGKRYDAKRGEVIKQYQNPLIPVLSYKIEF